ncbi:hypothetical protein E2C01_056787 [Portunus trituberculatus]|uniref:Uncharacterized protein n=1 Tax=Portunus trituberculatus TaxID=210409 RepID=A0A5B7H0J0_PORTR|nr:hypothetical protein [Portunus trituberculatus]
MRVPSPVPNGQQGSSDEEMPSPELLRRATVTRSGKVSRPPERSVPRPDSSEGESTVVLRSCETSRCHDAPSQFCEAPAQVSTTVLDMSPYPRWPVAI